VYDQIKCFFCDATFSCDIFGYTDLTEDSVRRIHSHQNNKCSFLIDLVGPIVFQRHLREAPYRAVVPRAPRHIRPNQNIGHNHGYGDVTTMDCVPITEDRVLNILTYAVKFSHAKIRF